MKNVTFKGKRVDNEQWVEGSLIDNNGYPYIVGNVVESAEDYICLEYWWPVEAESVVMVTPDIKEFLTKAAKWDALEKKISSYYFDEDGDELEDDNGGDLCNIGEAAATAFGYL